MTTLGGRDCPNFTEEEAEPEEEASIWIKEHDTTKSYSSLLWLFF